MELEAGYFGTRFQSSWIWILSLDKTYVPGAAVILSVHVFSDFHVTGFSVILVNGVVVSSELGNS